MEEEPARKGWKRPEEGGSQEHPRRRISPCSEGESSPIRTFLCQTLFHILFVFDIILIFQLCRATTEPDTPAR
jgi:hypothetical protein